MQAIDAWHDTNTTYEFDVGTEKKRKSRGYWIYIYKTPKEKQRMNNFC